MTQELKIQIAQAIADRAYKDGEARDGYDHVEGEDFGVNVTWRKGVHGAALVSVDGIFYGPDGYSDATPIEVEEITNLAQSRIVYW